MPRNWSLAAQLRSEKPRRPLVPACCPQCACRWYYRDEDLDWSCMMCGRTLVLWSLYRRDLTRWRRAAVQLSGNPPYTLRGADGRYKKADEAA